ncbi:hypothetical protein CGRA01v4_08786 [Colletotrichum graminicola]|nr:hypothetical protein CGRA01v4_08786 [Colletotrichum graminicola]
MLIIVLVHPSATQAALPAWNRPPPSLSHDLGAGLQGFQTAPSSTSSPQKHGAHHPH